MSMKNNNLKEVLTHYSKTEDGSLITDKIYREFVKFSKRVCSELIANNPEYLNTDELMSAINYRVWHKFKYFDETKSSIMSFTALIIKNALYSDITENKLLKGKDKAKLISFENKVSGVDGTEVTIEDTLNDSYIDDDFEYMILMDSTKPILERIETKYKNKRSKVCKSVDKIIDMRFEGYTYFEIARVLDLNKSYMLQVMKDIKNDIRIQMSIEGII